MIRIAVAARLGRSRARILPGCLVQRPFSSSPCLNRFRAGEKAISENVDVLNLINKIDKDGKKQTGRSQSKHSNSEGDVEPEVKRRLVVYRDLHFQYDEDFPHEHLTWRMTERAKENMYKDYKSDPKKWTVKALSEKYLVSPQRVPAVIRLMERREEFAKLCEEDPDNYEAFWNLEDEEEKKLYHNLNRLTGMSNSDESETGVPEPIIVGMNAASDTKFRVLNDEELSKFYDRVSEEAKAEVPLELKEAVANTPAKVLKKDPVLTSRTSFVITDISHGAKGDKNKKRDIKIRERDGTLRTPTGVERHQIEQVQYPSKRNTRLL